MKKILTTAILGISFLLAFGCSEKRVFFGIATGGTGGTYYPLGGMLAQIISNQAEVDGKKISATAETGNASVANSKLLQNVGIESAFIQADTLDNAYSGGAQFEEGALTKLRALGSLYPEVVHIVALKKSDINAFEDLQGKSASSGAPGSGGWTLFGELLRAYGMDRETDIQEDYSSFAQSVGKIKDGNLIASLIIAGTPTASVTELANGHDINIIPLQGSKIDGMLQNNPYFIKFTIPADTYKEQTEAVPTLAVRAVWATHDELDEEIAYQVVKTLYESTETLGKVHPKGKEISLETALESISIPFHPGAKRYFEEQGLTVH